MVSTSGLSRSFAGRVALDGLTLAIEAGQVVALLGPNGAGKTTTLRLLAGLISPSAGDGSVAGISLARGPLAAIRARVGLLTETPGLWDRLSVWTNLITHARLHGVANPGERVRAVLEQLRLSERAHDAAAVLSTGLRQRVAIARALLHAPPVLLLDEPTSGLDPAAAKDVRDLIAGLRRDGAAVLVCTHNLSEAEEIADRIAVLQTTLLAFDTPGGLRRRLAVEDAPAVVVEVEGDAAAWIGVVAPLCVAHSAQRHALRCTLRAPHGVPDVVTALAGAGARIAAVREERPSLEEAYLALVRRDG